MSKLAEQLRAIKIVNLWDLVSRFGKKGADDVFIVFHRGGRAMADRSNVVSPSHKTDLKAHWSDNGSMSFTGPVKLSQTQAIEWASKHYGIEKWVSCPFSPRTDKIPKTVMDRALKFLKEK
jgi:hypothetical protein